ncbi:MAG TPA: hypothetical protein VJ728_14025, partial [Candidatus Binataceae bacterium]|nr:hypothetical protein [Candidatus Binataceae bacterium]
MRIACIAIIVVSTLVSISKIGSERAWANGPSPAWTIEAFAAPTYFSVQGNSRCLETVERLSHPACDADEVVATNAGSIATDENDVTLTDSIPDGLTVRKVSFFWSGAGQLAKFVEGFNVGTDLNEAFPADFGLPAPCSVASSRVACTLPELVFSAIGGGIGPDETLTMVIYVTVGANAQTVLHDRASVAGGGASEESIERESIVSSLPAAFGISNFNFYVSGEDGKEDTRAADHPYEVSVTIGLNNAFRVNGPEGADIPKSTSSQDVKDIVIDLPVGFVGSILAAPECALAQLSSMARCPSDTVVGHVVSEPAGNASVDSAIYNLVPEGGTPAEFGFIDALGGAHVIYTSVVPTPAGYILRTTNHDVPAVSLSRITVTFYGDPAIKQEELAQREGKSASPLAPVPFFTNPTSCSGEPPVATIYIDSWQNPARLNANSRPS